MRVIDDFWRQYSQLLFLCNYYTYKRESLFLVNTYIGIASLVVSGACVVAWGMSAKYSIVWAAVIFVVQLANGLKDLLGTTKKVCMLDLYLPLATDIASESRDTWRLISQGKLTEDEILKKIRKLDEMNNALKKTYILPTGLTVSKKLTHKANERTDAELLALHGKD